MREAQRTLKNVVTSLWHPVERTLREPRTMPATFLERRHDASLPLPTSIVPQRSWASELHAPSTATSELASRTPSSARLAASLVAGRGR